jgi:hypothetical protein
MKRFLVPPALMVLALSLTAATPGPKAPAWSMNATVIEACSCPMFCQCFFNTEPAGHTSSGGGRPGMAMGEGGDHAAMGADHFCKFNNAYRINKGSFGATRLDGAKFWIYGDLGSDFSKGQLDWAVVTFDKATSKDQRDAIALICTRLFPVKWNSLTTAEGDIRWEARGDEAVALLDEGRTAEVRLRRFQGMTRDPVVIRNLKYWGAPRNDGFILMPNTVQALRTGDKPYEFKGTNGFMITVDIDSKTAPAAAGS